MAVFKLLRIMRTIHTIFSSPRRMKQMQEPSLSERALQMIHLQKAGWNALRGLTPSHCLSAGAKAKPLQTPGQVIKRWG